MADDGDQKGRSLYYHRYTPQIMGSGGGRSTYGAPVYGASSYGSAYGSPYGSAYAAPSGGGGEDEGGTGALSLGRIIRVCSGHWMTIFVFAGCAIGVMGVLLASLIGTPLHTPAVLCAFLIVCATLSGWMPQLR